MVDLSQVQRLVADLRPARVEGQTPKGHIRIDTGLLYPDGAALEVFVLKETGLFGPLVLSDLGQTTSWLLDMQVKPALSKKRQAFLEDAIRLHKVIQQGGEFRTLVDTTDDLGDAIMRLAQACLRVADLMFTRRSSLANAFTDEVEELIADTELKYETAFELPGRFGKPVGMDFLVYGRTTKSILLTLSSMHTSAAHNAANEVFRKWYDLDTSARTEQKVTIFDDRAHTYREEDLQRIGQASELVPFSQPGTLQQLIAA